MPEDCPDNNLAATEDHHDQEPGRARRLTSRVEIHTFGGWVVTLKAVAMARGNVQDERQLFAHLLNVPTIPFRLAEGGIGLINPTNITRVSAWPKPDALPGTALPLALRRWTPSFQRACKPALRSRLTTKVNVKSAMALKPPTVLLILVPLISGCVHYPVNAPLPAVDARAGYRFQNVAPQTNSHDLALMLAFSGGWNSSRCSLIWCA